MDSLYSVAKLQQASEAQAGWTRLADMAECGCEYGSGYDTPGKTPRGHSTPPAWSKAVPGRPRQNRTSCSTLGHIPGAGPGKSRPGTGKTPPTCKALSHPDEDAVKKCMVQREPPSRSPQMPTTTRTMVRWQRHTELQAYMQHCSRL